jgi:hypothetical protein
MELDVDYLIQFFKKYTVSEKVEVEEQESSGESSTGGGGGGGSLPKWADVVGGPQRGKANMLGKAGEKWQTGMTRGVSNQIW